MEKNHMISRPGVWKIGLKFISGCKWCVQLYCVKYLNMIKYLQLYFRYIFRAVI